MARCTTTSFLLLLTAVCFYNKALSQKTSRQDSIFIRQIIAVEKQFADDLNRYGAAAAFEKYAAPGAVIKRYNDTLITGSKEIGKFYSAEDYKTAKAWWKPDYVDVSKDGTIAYTYGKYQWKLTDKAGKVTEYSGVFHTVWKRQANGSWKYVWD